MLLYASLPGSRIVINRFPSTAPNFKFRTRRKIQLIFICLSVIDSLLCPQPDAGKTNEWEVGLRNKYYFRDFVFSEL